MPDRKVVEKINGPFGPERERDLREQHAHLYRRTIGLHAKFMVTKRGKSIPSFVFDLDHDTFAPQLQPNTDEGFKVRRADAMDRQPGDKHWNCEYYVVQLHTDPRARELLRAYAINCAGAYPQLALDINDWLNGKRRWL